MSDAIRVALESAIRTYESMSPGVITVEHKQAIEALQALQSGEPDTKTHINLCHSGEPVVDVIGMDEEDAMFTQIEAKARATYRRHTSWAKGQNISRGDGYESHLVWAALEWAEANTTPQPVVPEGFTKWLSAFVEVSNLSGIEDHEIAWTWPSPPNAPEFFANYPALTTGDLRELHALHLAVPPKVSRNDLIELLIATRNQSEGVTADLIIKLLSAGKETV